MGAGDTGGNGDKGLGTGAIIGISAGALAVLTALVTALCCCFNDKCSFLDRGKAATHNHSGKVSVNHTETSNVVCSPNLHCVSPRSVFFANLATVIDLKQSSSQFTKNAVCQSGTTVSGVSVLL